MKIKIQPLFIIVAAAIIFSRGITTFLSTFLAVFLHEYAHAFVARERGYTNGDIIFLPYGAVLYNKNNLDKTSNIIIALSGPLFNFLLSLLFISFWWIYPPSYAITQMFVNANIIIGFFNLLPVYPLDGARVILALFNYKPKVQKALKVLGFILSIILLILFFITISDKNFTLLIMAIFLGTASLSNDDKENFEYMLKSSPLVKDYDNGVTEKIVHISSDTTLKKALIMIKPNVLITFKIVKNGRVVATFSEKMMIKVFNDNKLTKTFNDII